MRKSEFYFGYPNATKAKLPEKFYVYVSTPKTSLFPIDAILLIYYYICYSLYISDKKSVNNEEIYKNGQNMVLASFSTTSQCDPGIDSPDILDLERISNRIHEKNKSIIVNGKF